MTNLGWHGRLRIDAGAAWWSGSVGDATAHRHFAAQAVFSNEPVSLIDGRGHELSGTCLLIEPDMMHRLLPAGHAEICFVEPAAHHGLTDALRDRLRKNDAQIAGTGTAGAFWAAAMQSSPRRSIDPRVARAMAVAEPLLPIGAIRLADVFPASGLSIGRFRHLFAAEIGMPFQRYILWCRLRLAFRHLMTNANVTHAAHSAGFADAAHFARTIKAMFGIRAGDIFSGR